MWRPDLIAQQFGPWAPVAFVAVFLAASFLMIWRLECLSRQGFEGTVLGTLVMPYCSGVGNLCFAFLIGRSRGAGEEVLINCLVNNVTNLTLLIGLPALIWGMGLGSTPPAGARGRKRARTAAEPAHAINRLSMMLTLFAVLFFSGAAWALARDSRLSFNDGLILVGLFLFWQTFHVFDVLKTNVQEGRRMGWRMVMDLALLGAGAWLVYGSIEWLVAWVSQIRSGWFQPKYLGWLSGWLMVLPNGVMALYYAARGRPEITYSSQVGDGHICIPLCLGIACLWQPIRVPAFFETGLALLAGATALHIGFILLCGGLPRWVGALLCVAYAAFLYLGLGTTH